MAFPFTQKNAWVVKKFNPSVKDSSKLLPFELGILDYDRCDSLGQFSQSPNIQFAIGSPNQKLVFSSHPKVPHLSDTNRDVSFKSDKIYGKQLLPARISKPSKTSKPQTMYLGFDGLNSCKTLDFKCGRTYLVNVRINPSPATALTFPYGIEDKLDVTIKACPECGDDCVAPNLCSTVIDELVTKINNAWTAPYVRAEKVIECCPVVAAPDRTNYTAYCITLCDEGDALALARVQNQYPTKKVVRTKRVKTNSTYEFWQLASLAAPASFTQTAVIIPDCPDCPAGYTEIQSGKILDVTIDNAGTDVTSSQQLAEVQSKIPTAFEAVKISFDGSVSRYTVKVPLTWTMPGSPVSETLIIDTGVITQTRCELTTPVVTPWATCGTKYAITRNLCIQLELPECDGTAADLLAELQTSYANVEGLVANSLVLQTSNDCQAVFEIEQYSDLMEDGCDTLAIAKFDPIRGFKGKTWDVCPCEGWTVNGNGCPVPPTVTDDECRCGIKFTGAIVDLSTNTCVWDPMDAVNYDHVRFEVSVFEQTGPTNPAGTLITDSPITHGTSPKRVFLTGQEVAKDVLKSRMLHGNEKYFFPRTDIKLNLVEATQYGVDLTEFYYAVHIPWNKYGFVSNQQMGMQEGQELTLYFAESDYGVMLQFLAAYNKYAASAGVSLPTIYV